MDNINDELRLFHNYFIKKNVKSDFRLHSSTNITLYLEDKEDIESGVILFQMRNENAMDGGGDAQPKEFRSPTIVSMMINNKTLNDIKNISTLLESKQKQSATLVIKTNTDNTENKNTKFITIKFGKIYNCLCSHQKNIMFLSFICNAMTTTMIIPTDGNKVFKQIATQEEDTSKFENRPK